MFVYLLTIWNKGRVAHGEDIRYVEEVCDSVETAWKYAEEFIQNYNDDNDAEMSDWEISKPKGDITKQCVANTNDYYVQLWIEKHHVQTLK